MSTVLPYFQDGTTVTYTLRGGAHLELSWDNATSEVFIVADVPANNYFSLGFGETMYNTDMILWQNFQTSTKTTDLWSTSHDRPVSDTKQSIVT